MRLPIPGQRLSLAAGLALMLGACSGQFDPNAALKFADPNVLAVDDPIDAFENEESGPIDPGLTISTKTLPKAAPANAHQVGAWSEAAAWPLSPVHAVMLSDGRVMTYGTNAEGLNGTGFIHDIWDWRDGLGPSSHLTLPHQTGTNIFCSAQGILPGSGKLMITGGDERGLPDGTALWGVNDVNVYDTVTGQMERLSTSMRYDRWYPTLTGLANGDQFVQGGRSAKGLVAPAVPEIYSERSGWRALTGLADAGLYAGSDWFYPRSFVMPNGRVLMLKRAKRELVSIDTRGLGSAEVIGQYTGTIGTQYPAVMYDVGKILAIRNDGSAMTIDVNGATPVIEETGASSGRRSWSDGTVLADGKVLLTGGARVNQSLAAADNTAEIWDPITGNWTVGASGAKARLYHSTSILLPDASVLVAGGGPPGPVVNMNAEIYRPPYLYRSDGTGRLAPRPRIVSSAVPRYGNRFLAEVAPGQTISRVTLVRTGSATHSFDQSQRFMSLSFTQSGTSLNINGPRNRRVAPPGTYMMFVIDSNGVPSIARMVQLRPATAADPRSVQFGTINLAQVERNSWIKVAFESRFNRLPAIVVGQISEQDGEPVSALIRSVTRTGFELKLDEWFYQDGVHDTEQLSFIAAEPGQHDLDGVTLQAQRLSAVNHVWRRQAFDKPFVRAPIVLAQRVSVNGPDPAVTRLHAVNNSGFLIRLQEEEARGAHVNERVDVIAISQGRGRVNGMPLSTKLLTRTVDERWESTGYGRVYPETPHLLTQVQSSFGGDPVVMRSRQAMPASVDIRLQEEISRDAEVNHLDESVGILSVRRR